MINRHKKWCFFTLFLTLALLVIFAAITIVLDPLFHYRSPLEQLQYPINDERYHNYGIIKNFEYDALITGTSMTQNFKTSEFDELFEANSIKVPFPGATNRELDDAINKALEVNEDCTIVLRSIDNYMFSIPAEDLSEGFDYPDYLYDEVFWNDTNYFLNKSIMFEKTLGLITNNIMGNTATTFDEYGNWDDYFNYGKDEVLQRYVRSEKVSTFSVDVSADIIIAAENAEKIVNTAKLYPDVEFIVFFPPYSIINWDSLNQAGLLEAELYKEQIVIETLIKQPNIKFYSFNNAFDVTTNLDNYKDTIHYSGEINSWMLEEMTKDTYLLSQDNYMQYIDEITEFYSSYDYDALFE